MRNIKLIMMYDGGGYAGWQRLGKATGIKPSIQAVTEDCIAKYLQEEIKIIASGRTDTGVHALGQTANFHCNSKQSLSEMLQGFNQALPEDMAILSVEDVPRDFHSRYSAKLKTYEYRIDQGETQSVFTRKYTYHQPSDLNLEEMRIAAKQLIGTHDFKAFSTNRKDGKSTVRTIESIDIYNDSETMVKNKIKNLSFNKNRITSKELRISITGDGFLYNMVRIITGTLLEVGQGIRKPEEITTILKGCNRQNAGKTAESQGLFLHSVKY